MAETPRKTEDFNVCLFVFFDEITVRPKNYIVMCSICIIKQIRFCQSFIVSGVITVYLSFISVGTFFFSYAFNSSWVDSVKSRYTLGVRLMAMQVHFWTLHRSVIRTLSFRRFKIVSPITPTLTKACPFLVSSSALGFFCVLLLCISFVLTFRRVLRPLDDGLRSTLWPVYSWHN